ncbi:hypothetical protein FA95DRAFT_53515 [Auriscalpium vulgare]|uniref:Uncharacterized protein n=1 Tax=Auriscalpium vulgare TaxID=40419 RepID=A0ACB8S7J1_9AGAM|nr:hypothetical protein FA95DRAFT_53515 [Auriscalpium vulgare]
MCGPQYEKVRDAWGVSAGGGPCAGRVAVSVPTGDSQRYTSDGSRRHSPVQTPRTRPRRLRSLRRCRSPSSIVLSSVTAHPSPSRPPAHRTHRAPHTAPASTSCTCHRRDPRAPCLAAPCPRWATCPCSSECNGLIPAR